MNNISPSLKVQDYLSLSGILFFIIALYLALRGIPNLSLVTISVSIIIDALDGYISRRSKNSSVFGKGIDSHADVLYYLVYPAVFLIFFLNIQIFLTLFVASLVLITGIFRLARFDTIGFIEKNTTLYYPGLGVMYIPLICAIGYIGTKIHFSLFSWLVYAALIIASYLMVSTKPFIKPDIKLWLPLIILIDCVLLLV